YYEALLAEAAAYLGGAATIADIGCGSGTVLSVLRQKRIGSRLIGVDLSESSLGAVRAKFAADPAVSFVAGSIVHTGLEAGSCDLVISTETAGHLYADDFAAGPAQLRRVLKADGRRL